MASGADFDDELTGEFVAETRDMLERIADVLIAWERDPADRARIDEVFRFVHTVKGSCGFLDLPRIAALAHAAETQLANVRDGGRNADAAFAEAMLAIIDRIALLVGALEAPETVLPPVESDAVLVGALETRSEAPVAELAEAAQDANTAATQRSVRVGVALLEALMNQVSDLVLIRNELARTVRLAENPALESGFDRLSAVVTDLRDSVTRTRMQPIDRLFATLPRLVRDTAKACGKQVELELSGQDVEIDREMVEAIRDPLIHIVRNAIDHGIESPEARAAAGKPATSVIRVAALQSGNQVSIEIADDGRGIDTGKLVAKALAARILDPARAAILDDNAAAQLVFEPGLSTAETVSIISGRGVGMDVVRANVERLGGAVALVNRPGLGLTIVLRAPLTLSIVNALVVRAGGHNFAVPRGAVEEVVALGRGQARLESVGGGLIGVVRDTALPAFVLADVMKLGAQREPALAMTLSTPAGGRYVLAVDAIDDQEELVVRPMAPQLATTGMFAGQSLGDDGRPVIVLDAVGIASALTIGRSDARIEHAQPSLQEQTDSLVLATAFDGRAVAVRTPMVERLIETARADWTRIDDRLFCVVDGRHLASHCPGNLPQGGAIAAMLVTDGQRRAVLAVEAVHDLVPCGAIVPVGTAGVEGLLTIDDRAVELLDALALLDGAPKAVATTRTARIRLEPGPWSQAVLAPLLAGAGYKVTGDDAVPCDLVIQLEGDEAPQGDAARVIALGRGPDGALATDLYDRAALSALIGKAA